MGSLGPTPQPHAVAIAVPVQGHINPLLYLCKHLASKGMLITFVTSESTHHQLSKSKGPNIQMASLPDTIPASQFDGNIRKLIKSMDAARGAFEELIEHLMQEGPPVTCIISDVPLAWTQVVAHRFGLPRASLWTSSASWTALSFHLPELIDKGYVPTSDFAGAEEDAIVDFVPGLPPMHIKHFPAIIKHDDVHDPKFVRRISRNLLLKNDKWVFVNTSNELETNALEAIQKRIPNFVPVGPLMPASAQELEQGGASQWAEDKRCLQWLDSRAPSSVLYASFGSLATLSASQVEEIAYGLEASKRDFLWVIRPNLVQGLSQEFVDSFIQRTKERGLVVSWAPQLQVLAHPSVAGFLTHCGWNSTLESIYMGVPMLCWPCMADQPLNSFFIVEQLEIGLRLSKEDGELVSREHIRDLVIKLMGPSGFSMRKKVLKLQQSVRDGVMDGGASHSNLDRFVREMTSS